MAKIKVTENIVIDGMLNLLHYHQHSQNFVHVGGHHAPSRLPSDEHTTNSLRKFSLKAQKVAVARRSGLNPSLAPNRNNNEAGAKKLVLLRRRGWQSYQEGVGGTSCAKVSRFRWPDKQKSGEFPDLIPMLCPPFLLTSLAGNPMFLLD